MDSKIVFIPGGGVPPGVSEPIVKEYSRFLGVDVELLPYPEYLEKDSKISIEHDELHFRGYLIKKYGKTPLVIIGFSLGAYFALDAAADKNINTKFLVLISPYIKKPNSALELIYKRIKSFFEEQGGYANFFSYPPSRAIKDIVLYKKDNLSQFKNIIMKLDLKKKMLTSDVRKLIIIGESDLVIPKYSKEELNMKNSTLIYIKGGHDILNSRDMLVVPILRDFLFKNKYR